jgi:hypothetical protein
MNTAQILISQCHPRMMRVCLALFVFLVAAMGCGPSKKYAGPWLTDAEIAVIRPDDKVFTHVNIISIDRNRLTIGESDISVLPGTHTLFFEAVLDYPFLNNYQYFNQYLTFQAEGGQVYTLHATILPMENKGFAWITAESEPEKALVKKYAARVITLPEYP